jgi:hypothetical protein
MNWINIETHRLRDPEYIGSEPESRGTWLNLLGFCCEKENGGVISDCNSWKDRMWQQTCGVTLKEVRAETALWTWEGNDLCLWGYPLEKEGVVRLKRGIARENGKSGGRGKGKTATNHATDVGSDVGSDAASNVAKRKGREGKGKEIEGKGSGTELVPVTPPDCSVEQLQDAGACLAALKDLSPDWSNLPDGPIISALGICSDRGRRAQAVKDFLDAHLVLKEIPEDFPLSQFKGYMRVASEQTAKASAPGGEDTPVRRFHNG